MSLKKHTALITIANIVSIVLGFISGVYLTRILGAEGRGVLAKMETAMQFIAQIVTLKVNQGITYYISNRKLEQRAVSGIGFWMLLASTVVTGLLLICGRYIGLGKFFFAESYKNYTFAIAWSILIFFFTQGQNIVASYLRGVKNFTELFQNQIFTSVFRIAIMAGGYYIGLRIFHHFSVEAGLLFHLFYIITTFIVSFIFYCKHFKGKPKLKLSYKNELAPFFRYTTTSFFSFFAAFLITRIDIWFVDYYSGSRQLGIYALASNLGALILLFGSTFQQVFLPYLVQGTREENIRNVKTYTKIIFTINVVISLVLYLTAGYFLPRLYGKEFAGSVLPFRLLIVGIFFTSVTILFSTYNYSTGKPRYNLYANLIGLVFMIVLDLALIPGYGIIGAALTSLITYFITAVLTFASAIYFQKLPLGNYFIPSKNEFLLLGNLIRRKLDRSK